MKTGRLLAAAALTAFALSFAPRDAAASLTSSERDLVIQQIAAAQPQGAARTRALVARPDLSADETAGVLSTGLAQVPFNDARAAFLHELLFGGASAASRPVLVPAVVRALVARADAVLGKHTGDLDTSDAAHAELLRIYGFIDEQIANAG